MGAIQGRAGAVEPGGSSADGAGRIARAVPARGNDDAVADGRRSDGGLRTHMSRIATALAGSLLAMSIVGGPALPDHHPPPPLPPRPPPPPGRPAHLTPP